ncbi:MAG: DUF4446 family protein [Anaerolineae bacterium]
MSQSQLYTIIAIGIAWLAIVALAAASFLQHRRYRGLETRYARLLEGSSQEGLTDILLRHVDEIQRNTQEMANLNREHDRLLEQSRSAVTHIGLVRYNPFDDMGGDFSVALALADSTGRGVVLSSLHGRTATRLYIRSLESWNSASPLSAEEQEALRIARVG